MSVAAPIIRKEFALSDTQMGILFSAFFTGYCVFCFVGGWGADRFGPRRVFATAAIFWSSFCAATALMTSFAQLLVVRVLFGIGEGPMGTTINKSITNWFPREEAGRAVGFIAIGQPLGAAVAAPLIGLLALNFGWRVAFLITGVLGVAWIAAWLVLFRDSPFQHPRVSETERAVIAASEERARADQIALAADTPNAGSDSVWQYLFSRRVIAISIAFFTCNYVLYFLLSWLPSYLVDYQHLDIKHMAIVGAIPWLGAAVGLAAGGSISDWVAERGTKRGRSPLNGRKALVIVGLLGASLSLVLTRYAGNVTIAVTLISAASIFSFMVPQTCWVLVREVVPSHRVGSTGGFVHLIANLAGIVAPGLTGWLVQHAGGYPMAFGVAAGLGLCASVLLMVLLRPAEATPKRALANDLG